ncbi:tetratricopeptide repeat protein [Candidatus Zixiibacteriota bacterium]
MVEEIGMIRLVQERKQDFARWLLRSLLTVIGTVCLWNIAVLSPCRAQSTAAVFDSATARYERGDYAGALAQYSALVQQGFDDPRIWYNLGNAQFKSGHLGLAIRAYLRAQRLAPRDPDIDANLQFVQLYTADKLEQSGRLFILGWADHFAGRFTLWEWLISAGILLFVLAILAGLKVWFDRGGRAGWYWLGFGLLLWVLTIGGAARCYHDDYFLERGVVVVAETDVRGGPGEDYTLQFTGHDGLLFVIDRLESDWYLVTFANGIKGWIQVSDVELI